MANRYWVATVSAIWNATSTANWSATSGGPSGASAPTSADNVFLDANSNNWRVICQDGAVCANLTCTGFTGELEVTRPGLTVHGNLTFSPTMLVASDGIILAGVGTHSILSNGLTIGTLILNTTGTYSQSDALSCDSIEIEKGTYLTNNYALSSQTISCYSTETSAINFGSSTVNSSIIFSTGASLTFTPGTSTVTGNSINTAAFARTFYNWSPTSSNISLTGNATFNNVTSTAVTTRATFGGDMTVTGTLTLQTGTSVNSRVIWASNIQGVQRTISSNSLSGTPTYYFFSDINITGSIAPLSSSYFGDLGNNSGITFPAPVTYYWVGGGGTWGTTTAWATSSGGTPTAGVFPLPQDSIVFDDNSGTAGITIFAQSGTVYVNSITATARTLSLIFSMSNGSGGRQLFVRQDVQFSSACTLTANSSITINSIGISLIGRVLQNLNLSGVTSNIPFQFNNSSGGVRLLSNLTVNRTGSNFTPAVQHTSGTVDTNGYAITVTGGTSYLLNGASPKTLIMGSTTLTTVRWQKSSNSGELTITGTGPIKITGTSFSAGNSTYYPNIECAAPSIAISGSSTIGNITNSYKTIGASSITFFAGSVCKFQNFNLAGEATRICSINSNNPPSRAVVVMENGGPIDAGSTSTSGGNNSGVTFTGTGTAGYLNVTNINSLAGNGFLSMM